MTTTARQLSLLMLCAFVASVVMLSALTARKGVAATMTTVTTTSKVRNSRSGSRKPASSSTLARNGTVRSSPAALQWASRDRKGMRKTLLQKDDELLPAYRDVVENDEEILATPTTHTVGTHRDLQIIQRVGCTRKHKKKKDDDDDDDVDDDDVDDDDDDNFFDCSVADVEGRVTLSPASSQGILPLPTAQVQPVASPTVQQPVVGIAPVPATPQLPAAFPTPFPAPMPTAVIPAMPTPVTAQTPTPVTSPMPTPVTADVPVVDEPVAESPSSGVSVPAAEDVGTGTPIEACQAAQYGTTYETPRNVTMYYQYELLARRDADLPNLVWPSVDYDFSVYLARKLVDCRDILPDNIFSSSLSSPSTSSNMDDWVLGVSPDPRDSFGTWYPSGETVNSPVTCTGVGEYDAEQFFCDVVTGSVTLFVKDGLPLSGVSCDDCDEEGSAVSNLVDLQNWVFSVLQEGVNNYETADNTISSSRGGNRKLRYRRITNDAIQTTQTRELNSQSPFYDPENGIYGIFFLSEPVTVEPPPPIDNSGSNSTNSAESSGNESSLGPVDSSVGMEVIVSLVGLTVLAMVIVGLAIQRRKAKVLAGDDNTRMKHIPDIDGPLDLTDPSSPGPLVNRHESSSLNSSSIAYSESDSFGYSMPESDSAAVQTFPMPTVARDLHHASLHDSRLEGDVDTYDIAAINGLADTDTHYDEMSLNNDPSEEPHIRDFGKEPSPPPISSLNVERKVIRLHGEEGLSTSNCRWTATFDRNREVYSSFFTEEVPPPPTDSFQISQDTSFDEGELSQLPSDKVRQDPPLRKVVTTAVRSKPSMKKAADESPSKSYGLQSSSQRIFSKAPAKTPPSKPVSKIVSPDSVVESSWNIWASPNVVPTPKLAAEVSSPEPNSPTSESKDETAESSQSRSESLKIRRRQLEDRFQMYKQRLTESKSAINESSSSSESWMSAREASRRQSVTKNDQTTTCNSIGIGSRTCFGTPGHSKANITLHDSFGFTPSSPRQASNNDITSPDIDTPTLGIMPRVVGSRPRTTQFRRYTSLNDIENILDEDQEWKADHENGNHHQEQENGRRKLQQHDRTESELPSEEVVNSVRADEENLKEFLHERYHAVSEPGSYAQFTADTVQL